jgi:hypothetical protein
VQVFGHLTTPGRYIFQNLSNSHLVHTLECLSNYPYASATASPNDDGITSRITITVSSSLSINFGQSQLSVTRSNLFLTLIRNSQATQHSSAPFTNHHPSYHNSPPSQTSSATQPSEPSPSTPISSHHHILPPGPWD